MAHFDDDDLYSPFYLSFMLQGAQRLSLLIDRSEQLQWRHLGKLVCPRCLHWRGGKSFPKT